MKSEWLVSEMTGDVIPDEDKASPIRSCLLLAEWCPTLTCRFVRGEGQGSASDVKSMIESERLVYSP